MVEDSKVLSRAATRELTKVGYRCRATDTTITGDRGWLLRVRAADKAACEYVLTSERQNVIGLRPVGVEPTKGLLLRQLRTPVPPRARS